jgi:hypothetical protein
LQDGYAEESKRLSLLAYVTTDALYVRVLWIYLIAPSNVPALKPKP